MRKWFTYGSGQADPSMFTHCGQYQIAPHFCGLLNMLGRYARLTTFSPFAPCAIERAYCSVVTLVRFGLRVLFHQPAVEGRMVSYTAPRDAGTRRRSFPHVCSCFVVGDCAASRASAFESH